MRSTEQKPRRARTKPDRSSWSGSGTGIQSRSSAGPRSPGANLLLLTPTSERNQMALSTHLKSFLVFLLVFGAASHHVTPEPVRADAAAAVAPSAPDVGMWTFDNLPLKADRKS